MAIPASAGRGGSDRLEGRRALDDHDDRIDDDDRGKDECGGRVARQGQRTGSGQEDDRAGQVALRLGQRAYRIRRDQQRPEHDQQHGSTDAQHVAAGPEGGRAEPPVPDRPDGDVLNGGLGNTGLYAYSVSYTVTGAAVP